MRINEIADAQEQLALLRLIIDNTWTAIKQQADLQARQQAAKPPITKPKAPKQAIRIPTPPKPKPLPKPTVTAQQQLQQNQLVNQLHTAITKSQSPNSNNDKRDTEMGSATQKF